MNDAVGTGSGRRSWWQLARTCSGTGFDRRNYCVFIAWLTAWAVTYLAASWVLQEDPLPATAVSWALAIVPTAFGVTALFAYLHFLRMADGPLRQVQLDGLAFGFGAGVISAVGYRLFEYVGAPAMRVSHIVLVMLFGWAVGQLLSMRRYL